MDRKLIMNNLYSSPMQYVLIIFVYLIMVILTSIASLEETIPYMEQSNEQNNKPKRSFPYQPRKRKSKPVSATYDLSDKQEVS